MLGFYSLMHETSDDGFCSGELVAHVLLHCKANSSTMQPLRMQYWNKKLQRTILQAVKSEL